MNVKKPYDYTVEEIRNLESNRLSWVDTVNRCSDEIPILQMRVNKPDIFPRTKIHQRKLDHYIEMKKHALVKIAECEVHLKPIWKWRLV